MYEAFMVEVGVYGNILSRSWKELNWYYNLWEPCNRLRVELEVEGIYHIKHVRQGDRPIIDVALEMGHRGKILESINVV